MPPSEIVLLRPGVLIRCPHCRVFHPVIQPYRVGTEYTRRMLFFECRRGRYYAGQIDQASRHATRHSA